MDSPRHPYRAEHMSSSSSPDFALPDLALQLHRNTANEVKALLGSSSVRDAVLTQTAVRAGDEVQYYLATDTERGTDTVRKPRISDLGGSIATVFDTRLPTIVIDATSAFAGCVLLGPVAQRRRDQGRPSCNVLFMPSGVDCGAIVRAEKAENGEHYLEVTHGFMLGGAGDVFVGELPVPVRADMVVTANRALSQQCADHGIWMVGSPMLTDLCAAKGDLTAYLAATGMRMPQRFTPDEMRRHSVSSRIHDPEAQNPTRYVIKPSVSYGGKGVRFFTASSPEDALEYYSFLKRRGYRPVIEEYIRSCGLDYNPESAKPAKSEATAGSVNPAARSTAEAVHDNDMSPDDLHDMVGGEVVRVPSPAKRKEWNVRLIVAAGMLIDIYARTQHEGRPVDWSAEDMTLQSLMRRLAPQPWGQDTGAEGLPGGITAAAMGPRVRRALYTSGAAVAKVLPVDIAGLDVTVEVADAGLQAVMLEANVRRVGGMDNIPMFHDDPRQKLAATGRLIRSWLCAYQGRTSPVSLLPAAESTEARPEAFGAVSVFEASRRKRLQCDLLGLLISLDDIGVLDIIGKLTEDEIRQMDPDHEPSHYEWSVWLKSRYVTTRFMSGRDMFGRLAELDEQFMRLAPLEFADEVTDIARLHPLPSALLPRIIALEPFVPSAAWDEARIVIWSELGMPDRVLAACRSAIIKGKPSPDIFALGIGELTHYTYDRFYPDAEEGIDRRDGVSLYSVYLSQGYKAAATMLWQQLDAVFHADKRALLAAIGLQLALAHNDDAQLTGQLNILRDTGRSQAAADLLHGMLRRTGPYGSHAHVSPGTQRLQNILYSIEFLSGFSQ